MNNIDERLKRVEDRIYIAELLPQKIGEQVAKQVAQEVLKTTQEVWSKPIKIDLSAERSKPETLISLDKVADCILYLPKSTGIATLYLDADFSYGYTVPDDQIKIRAPFKDLYVSNSLQSGKEIYLLIGRGDFSIETIATNPQVFSIEMTNADTEYSQKVPDGTRKFTMWCTDGTAFRYSWEPGHVATPTPPYGQIISSASYWEDGVYLINKTLYFACSEAGKTVILQCYT